MTKEEAEKLGYEVVEASCSEVGLVKNGHGVRTWWCSKFNREMPTLDHPIIMEAIEANEIIARKEYDLLKKQYEA